MTDTPAPILLSPIPRQGRILTRAELQRLKHHDPSTRGAYFVFRHSDHRRKGDPKLGTLMKRRHGRYLLDFVGIDVTTAPAADKYGRRKPQPGETY